MRSVLTKYILQRKYKDLFMFSNGIVYNALIF